MVAVDPRSHYLCLAAETVCRRPTCNKCEHNRTGPGHGGAKDMAMSVVKPVVDEETR